MHEGGECLGQGCSRTCVRVWHRAWGKVSHARSWWGACREMCPKSASRSHAKLGCTPRPCESKPTPHSGHHTPCRRCCLAHSLCATLACMGVPQHAAWVLTWIGESGSVRVSTSSIILLKVFSSMSTWEVALAPGTARRNLGRGRDTSLEL